MRLKHWLFAAALLLGAVTLAQAQFTRINGLYYLAGTVLFSPDATFNIGASGANRPNSIIAAGDITAGGGAKINFASSTRIVAAADGLLSITNAAATTGIRIQTGTPTIGTCGTSPSVVANSSDSAGAVNVGTGGAATSCTASFASTWASAPFCVAQNTSTSLIVRATASTTVLTLTSASAFTASDVIAYHCFGQK
jgi:hypothetical protein